MAQPDHYKSAVDRLKGRDIQVSFFIDPDPDQVREAYGCGADIVEIHTGHYSEARSETEAVERFERIVSVVEAVSDLSLGISAGHGLNYVNVKRH